jgi:LmbE family N-acetylglucosaminyl deacetylase
MLPFQLGLHDRPVHLVALGAHPDDIEIGCGGTLLKLAETVPELTAEFVIATGSPARLEEARRGAELFLPGCEVTVTSAELPDGRLPSHWNETKELLEATARGALSDAGRRPDLVLAPSRTDAHQDHRLIAELAPTVWRDHLVLHYEIPKWDGDFSRPWLYVDLTEEQLREKVTRLHKAFPSQVGHDWFDEEVFAGLARLRGMECRARYAEAFTTAKGKLTW